MSGGADGELGVRGNFTLNETVCVNENYFA